MNIADEFKLKEIIVAACALSYMYNEPITWCRKLFEEITENFDLTAKSKNQREDNQT